MQFFLSLAWLALESDKAIDSHHNQFAIFTGCLAYDQFIPCWYEFQVSFSHKQQTKIHNLSALN